MKNLKFHYQEMEPIKVEELSPEKTEGSVNHSLGLQDLYKAAFSQEYLKKDDSEETYQMYSVKQLPYSGQDAECFPTSTTVASYGVYETVGNNSVLDLDKGIQVQVVKMPGEELAYSCDTQILQRYLNEASLYRGESNDMSNPSSESLMYVNKPILCEADEENEAKLELKFEDCDFNSSDSFASTESIIPKNIKCPKCPKKFMFKSDLTRHNRYKHSSKQKLSCSFCNKEFPSQQNLMFHERSHKKTKENTCQICNKVFKKPVFFSRHMSEKHPNVGLFHCVMCSQVFSKLSLLTNHKRKQHNLPNEEMQSFSCETCGKTFDELLSLQTHMKTHVCDLCGKIFKKASYLKMHVKKHLAPESEVDGTVGKKSAAIFKPYKCEHCPKSFTYNASYNLHMQKHTSPKVCTECNSTFATSSDLTKHLRVHKRPSKLILCHLCSAEFPSKAALSQHVNTAHKATQETFTQTTDDLFELQNVNVVVETTNGENQSIVLTPLTNFNSVPFLITQPSAQSVPVPYSVES